MFYNRCIAHLNKQWNVFLHLTVKKKKSRARRSAQKKSREIWILVREKKVKRCVGTFWFRICFNIEYMDKKKSTSETWPSSFIVLGKSHYLTFCLSVLIVRNFLLHAQKKSASRPPSSLKQSFFLCFSWSKKPVTFFIP